MEIAAAERHHDRQEDGHEEPKWAGAVEHTSGEYIGRSGTPLQASEFRSQNFRAATARLANTTVQTTNFIENAMRNPSIMGAAMRRMLSDPGPSELRRESRRSRRSLSKGQFHAASAVAWARQFFIGGDCLERQSCHLPTPKRETTTCRAAPPSEGIASGSITNFASLALAETSPPNPPYLSPASAWYSLCGTAFTTEPRGGRPGNSTEYRACHAAECVKRRRWLRGPTYPPRLGHTIWTVATYTELPSGPTTLTWMCPS